MRHVPRNVLEARAGAMRAFPTFSEAALWEALKRSRLGVARGGTGIWRGSGWRVAEEAVAVVRGAVEG